MVKRILTIALLLALMLALAPFPATAPGIAHADEHSVTRVDGEIRGSSFSLFRPADWNRDLVLLVHGSLPDFFEVLAQDLTSQGFGVAFTTLTPEVGPAEGQALKEVTLNTRIVQDQFTAHFGNPERTYLYGFSRGAHNMPNLLETSPERYDGVFNVCGALGGSQLVWDYFFTARVLFDYFYPGVLPGDALISPINNVDEYIAEVIPLIVGAILANPAAAFEMAAVDQYELQFNDFGELIGGIIFSLAIHTSGVNSLIEAANGNPFDNTEVVYTGSSDDAALNAGVARLSADPQARAYLRVWYEPDGSIDGTPILALHTSRDPLVPERLNDKYEALVEGTGNGDFFVRRVVDRFGHCEFSNAELASHLSDLVAWVETGVPPSP